VHRIILLIFVFFLTDVKIEIISFSSSSSLPFPGNNRFTGSIPDVVTNLRTLRVLTLENNTFTGSLPAAFSALSALEVVNFSKNRLIGVIPSNLRSLTQLRVFNVSVNKFSGEIPDIFGDLQKLSDVDLSENEFSRTVPDSLFKFAISEKSVSLSLGYNSLDGESNLIYYDIL